MTTFNDYMYSLMRGYKEYDLIYALLLLARVDNSIIIYESIGLTINNNDSHSPSAERAS